MFDVANGFDGNCYADVRPVVSLKKDIVISGSTGIQTDPYVIE